MRLVVVLVLLSTIVSAQELFFEEFELNDMITDHRILSVFQDSFGYLWFGSVLGLNNYDGYTIRQYYSDGFEDKLLFDYVTDITEAPRGTIWFATGKEGLVKYDYSTNSFTRIIHDPDKLNSLSSNQVYCLASMGDYLWIATREGIDRLSIVDGSIKHYPIPDTQNPPWIGSDYDLEVHEGEDLVFVLRNGKLYSLNTRSKIDVFTPFDRLGGYLVDENVMEIVIAEDIIYAVTRQFRILKINLKEKIIEETSISGFDENLSQVRIINKVLPRSDGTYLLATDLGLFWNNSDGKWFNATFSRKEQGTLKSNNIKDISIDRTGVIWLATADGLQKINTEQGRFGVYHSKPADSQSVNRKNIVYKPHFVPGYGLLAIIQKDGVYRVDETTKFLVRSPLTDIFRRAFDQQSKIVTPVIKDGDELLLGCYSGLAWYNPATDSIRLVESDLNNPVMNGIRALEYLDENTLLIGTARWPAIYQMNLRNKEERITNFLKDYPQLNNKNRYGVFDFHLKNSEELWIAFYQSLVRLNIESGEFLEFNSYPAPSRSRNAIETYTMLEASDGTMWFGTVMGLYSLDATEEKLVYHDIAAASDYIMIFSIAEDKMNRIWLSTSNGIVLYDPVKKTSCVYTKLQGLPFVEFNINSAYTHDDGKLFFGGADGLVYFNPMQFSFNSKAGDLRLSSISINGEEYDPGCHPELLQDLYINHRQNLIVLHYSVLDYRHPYRNKLFYRISGLTNDWVPVENNGLITLQNLPAGSHQLLVKGKSSDGIWSEQSRRLSIHVSPPFYQTPWFMSMIIAAILGSVALAHFYRTQAIRKHNEKLKAINLSLESVVRQKEKTSQNLKKSQERLKNLNKILNNKIEEIYRLNNDLKAYNYSISNVLKVPVRHIIGYNEMMKAMDASKDCDLIQKMREKISNGVENLRHVVEGLSTMSQMKEKKLEFHSVDISNLFTNYAENYKEIHPDSSLVFDIAQNLIVTADIALIKLVRDSLLDNAVRFAHKSSNPRIEIGLTRVDESNYISVRDNGPGINEEMLSKVFQPFHAYHTVGDFSGTGLSLSIVRSIIERHGGRIIARNAEEGGAEFLFSLGTKDENWLQS